MGSLLVPYPEYPSRQQGYWFEKPLTDTPDCWVDLRTGPIWVRPISLKVQWLRIDDAPWECPWRLEVGRVPFGGASEGGPKPTRAILRALQFSYPLPEFVRSVLEQTAPLGAPNVWEADQTQKEPECSSESGLISP